MTKQQTQSDNRTELQYKSKTVQDMCSLVSLVIVYCMNLKCYIQINKEGCKQFSPNKVNSSKVEEVLSKWIFKIKKTQSRSSSLMDGLLGFSTSGDYPSG